MVNGICFPNTFLREDELKRLTTCFSTVILYRVTDEIIPEAFQVAVENRRVELRFPVRELHPQLVSIWEEFEAWSKMHKTSRDLKTIFFTGSETPPFFGETAPSWIAAELKRLGRQDAGVQETHQYVQAGLFLTVAHRYDRQYWEAEHDLCNAEAIEKKLFHALTGQEKEELAVELDEGAIPREDPGGYMISERIAAWGALFLKDLKEEKISMPHIFIASSSSVLEYVLDQAKAWDQVIEDAMIPEDSSSDQAGLEYRKALCENLFPLLKDSTAAVPNPMLPSLGISGISSGFLNVYRIKENPRDFFIRMLNSHNEQDLQKIKREDEYGSTLIALLK
ncbi:MAG: hypothetical protein AB1659_06525 [Thermodesulfobacteriota bacterium]